MTSRISLLCVAMLFGCSSENPKKDLADIAVARAAVHCASSSGQLVWLRMVIEESEKDYASAGRIYTFQSDGTTVFMHQPWIMSCLGCILYDCNGNRIDPAEIDQTILSQGFQNLTLIYDPPM